MGKCTTTVIVLSLLLLIISTNGRELRWKRSTNNQVDIAPLTNNDAQTKSIVGGLDDTIIDRFLVNGQSLGFIYWNTKLGRNTSINIEFGDEKKLVDYWIRGSPLKMITHGFIRSANDVEVTSIKSSYIDTGSYNVITFDWSHVSKNIIYPIPAYLTSHIGHLVAEFLKKCVEYKLISFREIHLIGHSFGAHIFAAAGDALDGKIGRITGMDPAAYGFEFLVVQPKHLNSTDAQFVDVIHSSAGTFGYVEPIGHVDFYPNGGITPQPGCMEAFLPVDFLSLVLCSHVRAPQYFVDSIYKSTSFKAVQCSSAEEYTNGLCTNNPTNFMGEDANPNTTGVFYLKAFTNAPAIGAANFLLNYVN
ncbi:Hypothetical protein CINCED_3A001355 [Cinara cedri]|nr:Hypothetical protein CINCED_3A001355 [Cinara cedri]